MPRPKRAAVAAKEELKAKEGATTEKKAPPQKKLKTAVANNEKAAPIEETKTEEVASTEKNAASKEESKAKDVTSNGKKAAPKANSVTVNGKKAASKEEVKAEDITNNEKEAASKEEPKTEDVVSNGQKKPAPKKESKAKEAANNEKDGALKEEPKAEAAVSNGQKKPAPKKEPKAKEVAKNEKKAAPQEEPKAEAAAASDEKEVASKEETKAENVASNEEKAVHKEEESTAKVVDNEPAAKGRGRKRKPDAPNGDSAGEPKAKLDKGPSISDSFGSIDFSAKKKSQSGKEANFKIASWNVNGLRAWLEKDGLSYLKAEQPDVLCVQEIKCDKSKIPETAKLEGYSTYWLSGDTEGYSGVGIYYKTQPIKITDGIGDEKHDKEGRVITAEFEKFYLVNTYIPNAGRKLVGLSYRSNEWDVAFRNYLKSLNAKKPVVWCGDLNVAHEEIDIKNASSNKKNAGFTKEERENFTATLAEGFFDSFRYLNPEKKDAYTFWSYFSNARAKNVGWRLDYFVLSEKLKENLCDSEIRSSVLGSDHCPIVLHLAL